MSEKQYEDVRFQITYIEFTADDVPVVLDDLLTGALFEFFYCDNFDAPYLIPFVLHMLL